MNIQNILTKHRIKFNKCCVNELTSTYYLKEFTIHINENIDYLLQIRKGRYSSYVVIEQFKTAFDMLNYLDDLFKNNIIY